LRRLQKNNGATAIEIVGARTHNLKGVSCAIPRGALTVITGVSGSGKSSLAFDTLYAEGQRRYVESMSTYARQFLERMPRPDVDHIGGVPPAIAIEQRNGVRNARSTVGTVTEISDYLRLLFARVGEARCPGCGSVVMRDSASAAAEAVIAGAAGERVFVVARVRVGRRGGGGATVAERLDELARAGHRRLFMRGRAVDIEGLAALLSDEGAAAESDVLAELREVATLPVLVDRVKVDAEARVRLCEALSTAFALGEGRAEIVIDGKAGEPMRFDEGFACSRCGRALRPPEPALFSFNSPLGACEACQGFGRVIGVDLDKVIPDHRKTLREGAVAPFQTKSNAECQDDLVKAAPKRKVRLDVPWAALDERERRWVIEGDPDYAPGGWKRGQWYGVRGFFRYLESKKYKMHVRVLLARYRGYDPCAACGGTRLRDEARAVFVHGKSIAEIEAMPVGELLPWIEALPGRLGRQARATAAQLVGEIASRLRYLDEVGLGYLCLARQARTLSGGESQRIALASALGARLTGTLYVLDEPSVGLHPRDANRLLAVMKTLTERGNTLVVVEHDPEILQAADHVIDLGPAAGARGGEVVFEGSFPSLMRDRRSVTGRFLRDREHARAPERPARVDESEAGVIEIVGARANNLRGVDARFPLGRLVCVTGVSGSGKSTLVVDVLWANAQRARGEAVDFVGRCDAIRGLERVARVELVDQSPLQRSSRSNPATYLKAMDELRARFAATVEAKRLDLGPGAFSFNVAGGRCEACQGQGTVTLEMHFLADLTVPCDACDGRRFGEKVLGVRWRGLTIRDCLDLTVDEALARFADDEKLAARLRPFAEVGLGYLTLGQSTSTLSGGESQRLKLAAHLAVGGGGGRRAVEPTLFLLDEPTTGLHGSDVETLLAALDRLIDAGHSVIAIEHNLDFIRRADWIIDLGPEGGDGGGQIVAVGTPGDVAGVRASHTGRALASLRRAHQKAS
jgi:excinuclease ABC subunit A